MGGQGHHGSAISCFQLLLLLLAVAAGGCHAAQHASAIAAAAAARTPLGMDAVVHGVAAARREVREALLDSAAAFEAYLAKFARVAVPRGHQLPGGPGDTMTRTQRLQLFTQNLVEADAFNSVASNALVARGITHFAHLTQQEFAATYLGQGYGGSSRAATAGAGQEGDAAGVDAAAAGAADSWLPQQEQQLPAARHRRLLGRSAVQFSAAPTNLEGEVTAQPAEAGRAAAAAALAPAAQVPEGATHTPQPRCSGMRDNPFQAVLPPRAVDWVSAGRTTAIKDQGACGSCVAFATTALAEWAHMTAFGTSNSTTDLSEQDLLECTGGNGCKGQHQELYIDMIACSGIAAEADEPYTARNDADRCKRHTRDSGIAATRGGGWTYVMPGSDTMSKALAHAPVMISIDAAGLALYKGGVVPCHVLGGDVNHAVTVVGYFDGVTSHNGEVLDVYLVRNSWGTWWGSGNARAGYAGHVLIRKDCVLPLEDTLDNPGIAPIAAV